MNHIIKKIRNLSVLALAASIMASASATANGETRLSDDWEDYIQRKVRYLVDHDRLVRQQEATLEGVRMLRKCSTCTCRHVTGNYYMDGEVLDPHEHSVTLVHPSGARTQISEIYGGGSPRPLHNIELREKMAIKSYESAKQHAESSWKIHIEEIDARRTSKYSGLGPLPSEITSEEFLTPRYEIALAVSRTKDVFRLEKPELTVAEKMASAKVASAARARVAAKEKKAAKEEAERKKAEKEEAKRKKAERKYAEKVEAMERKQAEKDARKEEARKRKEAEKEARKNKK